MTKEAIGHTDKHLRRARGCSAFLRHETVCQHDKMMSEAKRLWRDGCAFTAHRVIKKKKARFYMIEFLMLALAFLFDENNENDAAKYCRNLPKGKKQAFIHSINIFSVDIKEDYENYRKIIMKKEQYHKVLSDALKTCDIEKLLKTCDIEKLCKLKHMWEEIERENKKFWEDFDARLYVKDIRKAVQDILKALKTDPLPEHELEPEPDTQEPDTQEETSPYKLSNDGPK